MTNLGKLNFNSKFYLCKKSNDPKKQGTSLTKAFLIDIHKLILIGMKKSYLIL
jgi:hypothetical protein